MNRHLGTLVSKLRYAAARLRTRDRFRHEGLSFTVDAGVLNPTAFTASFVFARSARKNAPPVPARVLELGCGCGLTAISLASVGHNVLAIDLDPVAVANTRKNAKINEVEITVLLSDWDADLEPVLRFDYIVTNPPFLPQTSDSVSPALAARPGLEELDRVLTCIRRRLNPAGRALVMTSSLTGRAAFKERISSSGLTKFSTHTKKLFNETLYLDTFTVGGVE